MKTRLKKDSRGWTLMEMVVVLAVIAILAAILTPIITSYVERARHSTAAQDVKNIAAAVTQFNTDTRVWPIFKTTYTTAGSDSYNVLYTDGVDAQVGSGTGWTVTGATTSDLNDNLNENAMSLTTNGRNAWKGAYLELSADPWNTRYYLTAAKLRPDNSTDAAYVISAGPNQILETNFTQSRAGALTVGGDDILQRIR